jgi:uncharacterized protein (DUF362 family)/NAD-dependent dihydropyrimidine dehydrogenase PreA subunit
LKSKVAVIPCKTYESQAVYEAIERGIALLGGWESFVKPEEKILLKPNLLNRFDPERAVTTHPAVFGAVARSLAEKRFRRLSYGDSPGLPGSAEKTAEVCGIKAVADRLEIPFADFSHSRTVEYKGRIARKFEICQGVLDSDGIVSICKMKTHQLERITGAVKNLFGCVHGMNKTAAHTKYPDAASFAQMLIDLNLMLKARIHIMDGIVAMEGNGPASGNPVNMNLILISGDPVALDATFCRLIDLDPSAVPTVYYGELFGLGRWKKDDIEIVGIDDLDDYCNSQFEVSRGKSFAGGKWAFLSKLKRFTGKPVILGSRCVRCGACVAACPVEGKAVSFRKGKNEPPVYDYTKCIRCYCCQEMCPEQAIAVKRKLF